MRQEETCEITWDGYLHLSAQLAERYFPAGVCVAAAAGSTLTLTPLHGQGNGGMIFKHRNPKGDRSLLINEVLGFAPRSGRFAVSWSDERGALLVALSSDMTGDTTVERPHRTDRSRQGAGPVGRLPAGDRPRGDLTTAALGPSERARGTGDRIVGPARGEPAPAAGAGGAAGRADTRLGGRRVGMVSE